jgi:hypothetical protein
LYPTSTGWSTRERDDVIGLRVILYTSTEVTGSGPIVEQGGAPGT